MRDVPDVSLTAAGHDPYLLCLEGSCVPDAQGRFSIWLVSGTSAAAPSFAGIMALVDQKMGARQGQANYVLYRLAASNPGTCNGSSTTTLPTSNCIFNDTTVGNNAVPGESGYNTTAGKYQSGKGYDLATGLGSMNVANLVSKWNTVTFNPTNTTLVLNSGAAVTVPHGTLIDYAITVAPQSGTGTPTGDVALMQSTPWSRAIALSTLTGGAASGQTNRLPGGNYYMGAHYSGDKTFAASDSGSSFVMIRPETSHTALQVGGGFDGSGNIVPFPGAPYGSFMYLRADVGGSSGVGVPSGYVMFTDNGSPIGTYSLNSQGNTNHAGRLLLHTGRNTLFRGSVLLRPELCVQHQYAGECDRHTSRVVGVCWLCRGCQRCQPYGNYRDEQWRKSAHRHGHILGGWKPRCQPGGGQRA